MKSQLRLLVFIPVFLGMGSYSILSQEYYSNGPYRLVRSHYDSALVGGIDYRSIVKMIYPAGYDIISKRHYIDFAMDYSIGKNNIKSGALFRIGISPTVEEAEETALRYLCSHSGFYEEGSVLGIKIGDNCWFRDESSGHDDTLKPTKIMFLRKNVFFLLGIGNDTINIIPIAQAIDSMVVHGSPLITFDNKLNPPVVTGIHLSKSSLKLNEISIMTINAYDPKGKEIEYERTSGIIKSTDDPANVFRIVASHDNWDEPFWGNHIINAWVINEDGFVSRKYETTISF